MERIQLRNPVPTKAGPNIERWPYDRVRDAILEVLGGAGDEGVQFQANDSSSEPSLADLVGPRLGEDWPGSTGWYVTAVKLDMEARGEIERLPKVTPQRLRLKR